MKQKGQPMTLPPFKPDATCPKCGHEAVHTAYRPGGQSDWMDPIEHRGQERHVRTCNRCHYKWCEAVIPTPADAGEAGK